MLYVSAACFTIAFLLFITGFISRKRRFILIFMEFAAALLLYFDRMCYIYSGDMSRLGYIMVNLSNFAVFFLTAAIVFGFNMYIKNLLKENCGEEKVPKRLVFVDIASVLQMILVTVFHFTGFFYYIDATNTYNRGPGFLAAYIIPVVCPLIQYTVIRPYRSKLSNMVYLSIVLYIFVPIAMGIVQIFTYGISIVNMAMVMVSISLFIFSYLDVNETVKRAHRQEMKGLAEEKINLKNLFEETATAFVKAVEKKDGLLKDYPERAAYYAGKLAERAGMSKDDCDKVYYAALLHYAGIGDIPGYPFLIEAETYINENFDGKDNKTGLKGEEIPEAARIIAIAEDYVAMTTKSDGRDPLPYPTVREELIKRAGEKYDPEYALIMINIMDIESTARAKEEKAEIEKEMVCGEYRDRISAGIMVTDEELKISFRAEEINPGEGSFHEPALILFDSFDGRTHSNERDIADYHYLEYGEAWFDGHFISTSVRNVKSGDGEEDENDGNRTEGEYRVKAFRYEDRMKLVFSGEKGDHSLTLALPDSSRAVYLGITGENCHIRDIEISERGRKVGKDEIEKIAGEESFINRMESDLPNIQIDRFRSASTPGIALDNDLRLVFHSRSLPGAAFIWHCPILVLFYSADGTVDGPDYREYSLVKFNGEVSNDDNLADNRFSMKKNERFPGWEAWKEKNREGLECRVSLRRKGNAVTVNIETLGLEINNITTLREDQGKIYAALSGDEIAITDIRIR